MTEAEHIAQAARLASSEARELLTDMRSDMLEVPLGTAVCSFLTSWSERSGVAAVCDADESCDATPETRWELFSIVREALRNIESHAHADKVRLVLGYDGDDIVLEIADDGDGFDIPSDLEDLKTGGHFGVIGMTERAERVGGQLEVDSRPGEGCRLRVVVPALTPAGRGSAR
jgi:signal transduction histidine kinase